jgi:glycosyltransferase involved in cell wall biosynthesis
MDVAVIVPVFNGEKYLRRTLNSILAQTHSPKEIVLVDDGSTDGSWDIAQEFSKVTLLQNPNKGANASRRWGIQQSNSENIALLDQDDIWHPDHLRLLSKALEQMPECTAAFGECSSFSFEWEQLFSTPVERFQQFDPWKMFPNNSIATPSAALIRRVALKEIGGWPENLVGCADVYTWYRLSTDAPLVRSLSTTVGYRKHSKSMSAELRSQKFRAYFDSFLAAMLDALSYRMAVDSEHTQQLQQRLKTVEIIPLILEALESGENIKLQKVATEFETALAEESEDFTRSICNLLLFFIYPLLAQKPVLDNLLITWPIVASRTDELLLQKIVASRVFLKQLATHPLDRNLWFALLQNKELLQQKLTQYFSRH